jgi:hypothetical protein
MSFDNALLAELAERKIKLQLKEIKNYDDAVVTRNCKFVTAKVPNPLLSTSSSKLRSVGINTTQELLTCPSLHKEALKKKTTNLPLDDKSTTLLEMTNKPSYHSGFDNESSSSEETIYVDEDTDKNTLMSNPFRPGFGIESVVLRKGFSCNPNYTLFIDGQFIMKAKTQSKNGARSYLLTTTKSLKLNEKADILLGEVRATSDSNYVLYSLCLGQENRELVAIIQDKPQAGVRPIWLWIIPKVIKRKSSVFQQPVTDGLVKSYLNGKREDMIVLRGYFPSPTDDAYNTYTPSKTLKLLSNTEKDKVLLEFEVVNKNMFRLDFLHPFSILQAFAICLIRYNSK